MLYSAFSMSSLPPCFAQINGNAGACQIAEEILRGVVDEICTKTITVSQPGVARFLVEQEGSSILAELQAKFQVYISMDKVHWVPLEEEVNINLVPFVHHIMFLST